MTDRERAEAPGTGADEASQLELAEASQVELPDAAHDSGAEPEPEAAITPEPEADPEPETDPEAPAEPGPEADPRPVPPTVPVEPLPPGRPTTLRLAGIHLHAGSLALARAELEALAGRGALDDAALVDLAEARWRTGDLAGAAEAATVAISNGREDVIALVIAAEGVAAAGRPSEARRISDRAVELLDGRLDPIFAGMPRSQIWPSDPLPEAGTEVEGSAAWPDGAAAPPASPAADAFTGGRGALARGDVVTAAHRLGVALRLDPGCAQGVLDAVGERPSDPALALLAGDALRLLGREAEALEAFDVALGDAEPEPSTRVTDGTAPDDEA